jgi:hypothetical protein
VWLRRSLLDMIPPSGRAPRIVKARVPPRAIDPKMPRMGQTIPCSGVGDGRPRGGRRPRRRRARHRWTERWRTCASRAAGAWPMSTADPNRKSANPRPPPRSSGPQPDGVASGSGLTAAPASPRLSAAAASSARRNTSARSGTSPIRAALPAQALRVLGDEGASLVGVRRQRLGEPALAQGLRTGEGPALQRRPARRPAGRRAALGRPLHASARTRPGPAADPAPRR